MTYFRKIGVVSLLDKIINPKGYRFADLYQAIGLNTGNFMFTAAIYRQLDGDLTRVGFSFDPDYINKEFDALVIPAANWINARSNWDWLIDLLERTTVPIITIGIGVQSDVSDLSSVRVNESSWRLINTLSKKSKYISTRGEFTRDWLWSNGIKNIITTGCPSLYMKIGSDNDSGDRLGIHSVIAQSTRFYADKNFISSNDVNSRLFRMAARLDLPMIYQSEAEEISYLVYGSFAEDASLSEKKAALLASLYGLEEAKLAEYIRQKGMVYFDVDEWSNQVSKHYGVVGTRLHGSIVALNSNKPACLILHDSRTRELAEFADIPRLQHNEFDPNSIKEEDDLIKLLDNTDKGAFLERRKINAKLYTDFLHEVGFKVKSEGILS